jgi:pimeloyl-ACP methyl ester carboxylesterase
MATFVVAHGAWSAGWAWKKMHPLMAARGHRLFTPSYTGLGERAHLGGPHIDLETHIADIVGVLEMEDLRGVILIGHSYGGMVATGVADRARDRIAQLVYLDSFAPKHGDSVFSLLPAREARRERRRPRPATAGRCRRIRCRPTRPRPIAPGPSRAGARSRSRPTSSG